MIFKPARLAALWAITVMLVSAAAATPAAERQADFMWDLRDLYPTPEAWDSAVAEARGQIEKLDRFKPGIAASAESMREALTAISDLRRATSRLGVYARLKLDEDQRVAPAQERRNQIQALETRLEEKTAWLAPAILAAGPERVRAFIASDAVLQSRFDFFLEDVLRRAPHTLGAEAEGVLAATGIVLEQPNNIFQQIAEAELPRSQVTLSTGKKVRLDPTAYEANRTTGNRADRKRIFDAFFGSWKKFQGTLGANLTSQVNADVFMARARHFDDSLSAALFAYDMPPAVYRTLVEQTHAALPALHRYLRLRKKMLGIRGDLAYYDNYPPLVSQENPRRFNVDDSKALVLAALAPLGDEYLELLKRGFAARWVNVLPAEGKASGGYMAGAAYDVHPYLLLNHRDDYESLSTLAHEWGHAIHTLLTNANQPFEKAQYSGFIAESAAIANEMLLNDHLVATARSPAEELFYLSQGLESIRTAFFRQVMFAEFQLAMHQEVEQGRSLSGQRLSDLYCGLLKRYYGEASGVMKIDPAYCTEWAYIPHFYFGYYVYQYATSIAGAAEFTEAIRREGAPARDRYLNLLKAGGSDYPYPLYRRAGVDLAQPAPYRALIARMNRIMDEIEQLARRR